MTEQLSLSLHFHSKSNTSVSFSRKLSSYPECNTPRKAKFKMIYSEEQQQVFDDLVDPSKFTFVFDCHRGFGTDIKQAIFDVFDGPMNSDQSYSQLLTEYYNVIESGLDEFRTQMAENAS